MRIPLLVVAGLLALAGCGTEATGEPAAEPVAPEDAFIAELRETVPAYAVEPEKARWIDLGWDACQTLDTSDLSDDVIIATWAELQGVERDYAAAGLKAARAHLCTPS